jgi:hypothetical protein
MAVVAVGPFAGREVGGAHPPVDANAVVVANAAEGSARLDHVEGRLLSARLELEDGRPLRRDDQAIVCVDGTSRLTDGAEAEALLAGGATRGICAWQ